MTPAETANILRQFNEWRRGDEDIPQFDPCEIGEAIDAAVEMIERLEEAESDGLEQARLNGVGSEREAALMAKLEAAEKERDALRAKIEEMEKQFPICRVKDLKRAHYTTKVVGLDPDAWLYALPGAQPTSSVPEGWLRAIDEALVVAHIGIANESDTYEQAKAKLDNLIGFHVDVATDPAVNGGWKLVPTNPTETFYQCFSAYDGTLYSNPFDYDDFVKDWREALAADPEAKP